MMRNSIKGSKISEANIGQYQMRVEKRYLETCLLMSLSILRIVPEFENTYFKEVLEILRKKFKLGRVRLLLKEPRSTLKLA